MSSVNRLFQRMTGMRSIVAPDGAATSRRSGSWRRRFRFLRIVGAVASFSQTPRLGPEKESP